MTDRFEDELEVELMPDVELLLLSWTQLHAVEMIAPDEEAMAGKTDLAATLSTNFHITDIELSQRTFSHYEVSYREKDKPKSIRFDIDEVESIYDL